MVDLINKFRRLIHEKYDDKNETSSSNEKQPPGQQVGKGDVNLTYLSLYEEQTERIQVNQRTIDGQYFQREVKNNGGVLLDMFNSNAIYWCKKNEMDEKASHHMTRTRAYLLVQELKETNSNYV